jgi:SAM-dependent methyltransferase
MSTPCLLVDGGGRIPLEVERWRADPDDIEAALLDTVADPVLDIGCGPGRIVRVLGGGGRVALGIDPSPAAAREAGRRRAPVLQRSVFAPLPGEGRWGTALLLDGNVGIGGDPVTLLARVRQLLRPEGEVVAELEPAGAVSWLTVRLEVGGEPGPRFPWATVGPAGWRSLADSAGLVRWRVERIGDRWFGRAARL